jgi:hypothetical protein
MEEAWASLKGYYDATVQCPDGKKYEVTFYNEARLHSRMLYRKRIGKPWYCPPGLVIVDDVTEEVMEQALAALWEEGWFNHLKPLDETEEAAT